MNEEILRLLIKEQISDIKNRNENTEYVLPDGTVVNQADVANDLFDTEDTAMMAHLNEMKKALFDNFKIKVLKDINSKKEEFIESISSEYVESDALDKVAMSCIESTVNQIVETINVSLIESSNTKTSSDKINVSGMIVTDSLPFLKIQGKDISSFITSNLSPMFSSYIFSNFYREMDTFTWEEPIKYYARLIRGKNKDFPSSGLNFISMIMTGGVPEAYEDKEVQVQQAILKQESIQRIEEISRQGDELIELAKTQFLEFWISLTTAGVGVKSAYHIVKKSIENTSLANAKNIKTAKEIIDSTSKFRKSVETVKALGTSVIRTSGYAIAAVLCLLYKADSNVKSYAEKRQSVIVQSMQQVAVKISNILNEKSGEILKMVFENASFTGDLEDTKLISDQDIQSIKDSAILEIKNEVYKTPWHTFFQYSSRGARKKASNELEIAFTKFLGGEEKVKEIYEEYKKDVQPEDVFFFGDAVVYYSQKHFDYEDNNFTDIEDQEALGLSISEFLNSFVNVYIMFVSEVFIKSISFLGILNGEIIKNFSEQEAVKIESQGLEYVVSDHYELIVTADQSGG